MDDQKFKVRVAQAKENIRGTGLGASNVRELNFVALCDILAQLEQQTGLLQKLVSKPTEKKQIELMEIQTELLKIQNKILQNLLDKYPRPLPPVFPLKEKPVINTDKPIPVKKNFFFRLFSR